MMMSYDGQSFSAGLLPDEWKHAYITPLHKKGSKSSRENYRPISLTSIACKIGEKIVLDRMITLSSGVKLTLSTATNLSFKEEDQL